MMGYSAAVTAAGSQRGGAAFVHEWSQHCFPSVPRDWSTFAGQWR